MNRRRLRKFILITGTLLCVLIAATFAVSVWWIVAAQAGKVCIYIAAGSAVVLLDYPLTMPFVVERHFHRLGSGNAWKVGPRFFALPLYAVFLAVALPTLLVCRFVPEFPRGHCRRCGYNLTGLTEARCPECGQPFEARGNAP